ncbi:hypothetical protein AAHB60_06730 [Pseudomonas aeruginosa]
MQLFIAPFRTLFNVVSPRHQRYRSGLDRHLSLVVAGIEKVAEKIPAALGRGIRSSVAGVHDLLSST